MAAGGLNPGVLKSLMGGEIEKRIFVPNLRNYVTEGEGIRYSTTDRPHLGRVLTININEQTITVTVQRYTIVKHGVFPIPVIATIKVAAGNIDIVPVAAVDEYCFLLTATDVENRGIVVLVDFTNVFGVQNQDGAVEHTGLVNSSALSEIFLRLTG